MWLRTYRSTLETPSTKDVLKRTDHFYTNDYLSVRDDVYADLTFENIAEIGEELMSLYESGEFSKICVVYNQFPYNIVPDSVNP